MLAAGPAVFAVAAAAGAAACGAAAIAGVIAAAARAIAHPMRFILTPKNGLQDVVRFQRGLEIGGLIGGAWHSLKGG
jgi:hypothetical protein